VNTPDTLLTVKELCHKLRCSRSTLDKLRTQGLPVISLGTRDLRFAWPEVYAWLQDRKHLGPASEATPVPLLH
jgi:predicted DNA-binding transcriptional regulator AlpA